jgi:hypothetical protein
VRSISIFAAKRIRTLQVAISRGCGIGERRGVQLLLLRKRLVEKLNGKGGLFDGGKCNELFLNLKETLHESVTNDNLSQIYGSKRRKNSI